MALNSARSKGASATCYLDRNTFQWLYTLDAEQQWLNLEGLWLLKGAVYRLAHEDQ
jgi:hypothetical protein